MKRSIALAMVLLFLAEPVFACHLFGKSRRVTQVATQSETYSQSDKRTFKLYLRNTSYSTFLVSIAVVLPDGSEYSFDPISVPNTGISNMPHTTLQGYRTYKIYSFVPNGIPAPPPVVVTLKGNMVLNVVQNEVVPFGN
jgi:hypothetical protein